MGASPALALGVGLVITLFRLNQARTRGGWLAVKAEMGSDAWTGVLLAIGIWIALFGFFVGAAVFRDHKDQLATNRNLSERLNTCSQASQQKAGDLQSIIGGLRTDVAVRDGVNQTLQKQNRDEQVLIAGCQSQALKLLIPPDQKITPILFDRDFQTLGIRKMRWLVLTNKSFTPVHIATLCNIGVNIMQSADVDVLGGSTGIKFGGAGGRLSSTAWELRDPGTWSPESPLMVTITYAGQENVACSFTPR
jgi:hypothetical protein